MNIVVAMKQIPDLQQIRIKDRKPILDDVPSTFGSLDKNALQAAVNLRDAMGGKVIALSIGNTELEDTVKEALAAGADEAFLVADDEYGNLDSMQSALILAESISKIKDVGLILLGEGSGDNYSGQTIGRVAELMDLPQISYAKSIEINNNTVSVIRALEDCEEHLEADMPAIISVVAEINEIKIPSVTQILKAAKKPKEVLDAGDIETELPQSAVENISIWAPLNNRKKIVVKNTVELIEALKIENLI